METLQSEIVETTMGHISFPTHSHSFPLIPARNNQKQGSFPVIFCPETTRNVHKQPNGGGGVQIIIIDQKFK